MRRVLTILTAILLVVVSLGIGVVTADLPFWQRALQLPLDGDAIYPPLAHLGTESAPPLPAATAGTDTERLEPAVVRARDAGARAFLVMHEGHLLVERYFAADHAGSLLPATLVARPLAALAVGVALGEGRIPSLDAPLADSLREWQHDPRGRITLRQLLEDTSGLEQGEAGPALLHQSPWQNLSTLPHFATSRGVRLLLGNDFQSTALGFRIRHEPGGFYNASPVNTQLAALVVERRSAQPYETFVDSRLWRSLDAGLAELPLDRRAGMPAAHCCWRATARDMMRVVALLAHDGRVGERQVVSADWIAEMAKPSRVHAQTGMQLQLSRIAGEEALGAEDGQGGAFWVFRSRRLAVLTLGSGGAVPPELPALVLGALAP